MDWDQGFERNDTQKKKLTIVVGQRSFYQTVWAAFEKYGVIIMCYQRSRLFVMDQPRTEREKRYGGINEGNEGRKGCKGGGG